MKHLDDPKIKNGIAFFDFDGTLTTGDTLMPYLKFVVGAPVYYLKLMIVSPIIIAYLIKLIPNDIAKEMVVSFYLKGKKVNYLFDKGEEFVEKVIPKMLRSVGMEKLRYHQNKQHHCVIVSASFDLWLLAFCKKYNFDNLICTKLEISNDKLTGKLNGRNCFGPEKTNQINIQHPYYESATTWAYGDSSGDYYMLNDANFSFLFNKRMNSFERF